MFDDKAPVFNRRLVTLVSVELLSGERVYHLAGLGGSSDELELDYRTGWGLYLRCDLCAPSPSCYSLTPYPVRLASFLASVIELHPDGAHRRGDPHLRSAAADGIAPQAQGVARLVEERPESGNVHTEYPEAATGCQADSWDSSDGAPVTELDADIAANASSSDSCCPAANASAKRTGSSEVRTVANAASASRRAGPANS